MFRAQAVPFFVYRRQIYEYSLESIRTPNADRAIPNYPVHQHYAMTANQTHSFEIVSKQQRCPRQPNPDRLVDFVPNQMIALHQLLLPIPNNFRIERLTIDDAHQTNK